MTCQTYPRSTHYLVNFFERVLTLTCPLAAEIALLPTKSMEFEVTEFFMPVGSDLKIKFLS